VEKCSLKHSIFIRECVYSLMGTLILEARWYSTAYWYFKESYFR